jgi:DNA-binding NarL/FixJ family response regulator
VSAERVLIGLHDRLVADAFCLLLGDAGFLATACSPDPAALVERARLTAPDLLIVGADVVARDGSSDTLAALRREAPATRIVVILRKDEDPCARSLFHHAVGGVIPMGTRTSEAIGILRQVLDGNVVYPELMLEGLIEPTRPDLLSERQREVLALLALGRSNDEIARRLFISRNTVKFHLREIYSRLGVRNRVEATRAARHARDR